MQRIWSLIIILVCLPGCSPDPQSPSNSSPEVAYQADPKVDTTVTDYDPGHDYFSFANTDAFVTRHLALNLKVDFDAQQLTGDVVLHLRQLDTTETQLVLDSRGLLVEKVTLLSEQGTNTPLEFALGATHPVMGEALTISLPRGFQAEDEFLIQVEYKTGPNASALMWLSPDLTAGGQHPFMFSQSQSIHARSWIPLQDSPAVRVTYEAQIQTPPDLLALMSADNNPLVERNGDYRFSMPQPIPSYLLALAVGNVFFESFGNETGVYAEPEVLQASAYEFADTQDMLDAAVEIYGPYLWGRYDLLILPPSFPFGGMENPRLSFITPSVLAGDRSLVSLIAHELAHSWSGNMVSNATWRDIWLNEGTTSYLEARLMEVLFGKERADEERLLGYQSLVESLQTVPDDMQALAPEFSTGDPDVGQGTLVYSKGQLFLENLEARFGRELFDGFMSQYFAHFSMQAIGSEQFLQYLDENLLQKHPTIYDRAQVEQWLYQAGIPENALLPTSANLDQAAAAAKSWANGELEAADLPYSDWSPQATVYFIKALPADLPEASLAELDDVLKMSQSRNAEISRAWFIQVAQRQYQPAYEAMQQHLNRFGRTRLVKPVYQALIANGEDAVLARNLFEEAKSNYHPLTSTAIERLFTEVEKQL